MILNIDSYKNDEKKTRGKTTIMTVFLYFTYTRLFIIEDKKVNVKKSEKKMKHLDFSSLQRVTSNKKNQVTFLLSTAFFFLLKH